MNQQVYIGRTLITGVGAVLAVLALMLAFSGAAHAAGPNTPNPHATFAPGHNKIQCFDGTTDGGFGGTCTLKSNGVNAPATLSNNSSNPNWRLFWRVLSKQHADW